MGLLLYRFGLFATHGWVVVGLLLVALVVGLLDTAARRVSAPAAASE